MNFNVRLPILLLTFVLLLAIPIVVRAAYGVRHLWIGYELPTGNLANDARRKEGEFLEDRNVANQACRSENEAECRRQNEIAFRKKLSGVPGVKFYIVLASLDNGHWDYSEARFYLHPENVSNANVDLLLYQIPGAGQYVPTGLHEALGPFVPPPRPGLAGSSRRFIARDSDNSEIPFTQFPQGYSEGWETVKKVPQLILPPNWKP